MDVFHSLNKINLFILCNCLIGGKTVKNILVRCVEILILEYIFTLRIIYSEVDGKTHYREKKLKSNEKQFNNDDLLQNKKQFFLYHRF